MKIRYLTGGALAALALVAVQSQAQTPPAPPPVPANGAAPVEHVCEVDTTVDGKTTTYRYVVRKFDGAPGDLPPLPADGPPNGQPGDQTGDLGPGHIMGPHHPLDLAQLDTDKNGKVSFAEFTAPMHDMFDRLDANHDGTLDASELPRPGMGDHHWDLRDGDGHGDGPWGGHRDGHWGGGRGDMPPPPPPGCGS